MKVYNMTSDNAYLDYSTCEADCYIGANRFLRGLAIFWSPVFGLSEL